MKFDQTTGVPTYQFVNKHTGAYLAIDLVTDKNGESENVVKLNGAGNKNWGLHNGVLYAYANDSIYTLTNDLKLKAEKTTELPGSGLTIYGAEPADDNTKMTMSADAFNAMLKQPGSDGKLHFNNGKDVSAGEENVLTGYKWTAYKNNQSGVDNFFLGVEGKKTSDNKNPYLLMVDTTMYSAINYPVLKFGDKDTLSLSATDAAEVAAGTYDASTYDPTDVDKYVRPISAALFNAEYYYAKDSVVIRAVGVPQKTSASAITDGTKRFGTKVGRSNASITVNDEDKKTIPGYEAAGAASGVPEKVKNLKTAVDNWLTEAARGNRSAAGYDVTGDTFSASSFDADGELKAEGSGGNKANDPTQGLLTLAKTAIDGEADATKKAEYLKFLQRSQGVGTCDC